MNIQFYLGFSV